MDLSPLQHVCLKMTPAELHRWARPITAQGLELVGLLDEELSVLQALQAVEWLETKYATAWRAYGRGSNNMGAVQYSRPPCDPVHSFQATDTSPNADGTSTPYTICFTKYATPADGAAGCAREMYNRRPLVLAAARRGDFYGVSVELHRSRYYEGFGATVAERIRRHYEALSAAIAAIAQACDELVPTQPVPKPLEPWTNDPLDDNPLVMRGIRGMYVKVWQTVLDKWLTEHELDPLAVDGIFGPVTDADTRVLQSAWSLVVDGKVGPKTWKKAAEVVAS